MVCNDVHIIDPENYFLDSRCFLRNCFFFFTLRMCSSFPPEAEKFRSGWVAKRVVTFNHMLKSVAKTG